MRRAQYDNDGDMARLGWGAVMVILAVSAGSVGLSVIAASGVYQMIVYALYGG